MPGMFGTLVVQLPSKFEGGELVLRHRGAETVYNGGSDDGSCAYNTFFTAFYADVEHEVRPVTKGWRLALVYNLAWIGSGVPPSVEESGMAEVVEELLDYAEEEKDEQGRWSLAFGLEHRYTEASLARLGTRALKGHDRLLVGALCAAAKESEVGELDVVLCMLSRTDMIAMDDWGQSVIEKEKGAVHVEKAFAEDGSKFNESMPFVQWEEVTERACFEMTHDSGVEFTGNEGATKETTYSTTAAVLWPKSCATALMYTPTRDVARLLQTAPDGEVDKRADLLLNCREAAGFGQGAWVQLRTILHFCAARKLCKQACRAIRLASKVAATPSIDVLLMMVTRECGWDNVQCALKDYFTPEDVAAVQTMEHRLRCIITLKEVMPPSFVLRALSKVIEHIRRNGSFKGAPGTALVSQGNKEIMWADLLRVVHPLLVSAVEGDQDTIVGVQIFEDLVPRLCESDVRALDSIFRSPLASDSEIFKSFQRLVRERLHKLLCERFIQETEQIARTHAAPKHSCAPKPSWTGMFSQEKPVWIPFLELVDRLLSTRPVQQDIWQHFEMFTSAIPRLSGNEFSELKSNVHALVMRTNKFALLQVQVVCVNVERAARIADMQKQMQHLTRATAKAPCEVQVCYPKARTGHKGIDAFLAGNTTEMCVKEFTSVVGARKLVRQIEAHLPAGMQTVAGGTGRRAFVQLQKPHHEAHERRKLYMRQRAELGRLRTQMARLESEMGQQRLDRWGGERAPKRARVEELGDCGGIMDGDGAVNEGEVIVLD